MHCFAINKHEKGLRGRFRGPALRKRREKEKEEEKKKRNMGEEEERRENEGKALWNRNCDQPLHCSSFVLHSLSG